MYTSGIYAFSEKIPPFIRVFFLKILFSINNPLNYSKTADTGSMREAKFYKKLEDNIIRCELCPHYCLIDPDERGKCGVRKNKEGQLRSENYGLVSAMHFDPVEKKPLYHFYPGKSILSFGSVGCNLSCQFCQNCDISQATVDDYPWLNHYTIDQVMTIAASDDDSIGIAFTYNEPTIYYEFMKDIAERAHKTGFKNVMISNGFITQEPLEEIMPLIDAFNIDLKSFNNDFYKRLTDARIKPVKETLKRIAAEKKHLEITNLIIPTMNDAIEEFRGMLHWIRDELGENTVLHLSRYFPAFQMTLPATPRETLAELFNIAKTILPFTYLGNINTIDGSNTYCPDCSALAIMRSGYHTTTEGLDEQGKCLNCQKHILTHLS